MSICQVAASLGIPLIPSRSSSLIRLPGHVHAYERTCVLNGPGECALSTADGFVHIVAGAVYIENYWNLVLTLHRHGGKRLPSQLGEHEVSCRSAMRCRSLLPPHYPISYRCGSYVTKMFPWLGFRSFNFGIVSATANASTLTLQCAPKPHSLAATQPNSIRFCYFLPPFSITRSPQVCG